MRRAATNARSNAVPDHARGRASPGARTTCEVERDQRRDRSHARTRARVAANGTGSLGFDETTTLNPPDASLRELAELPGEHRPDHRDVHEDEHDQREHAERHRRPEPAGERIREPEPHLERPVGEPSDRVTDRALLLRHEHHRRAHEHQALRDEQEHTDAAVQRERDRHRDDTPDQHDHGQGRR